MPGTRLGPFEVLQTLGRGGMGEVYRARDTRLGRDVALKILPSDATTRPRRFARFVREARVLAHLQHPHICALYDTGTHEGATFLVMEYLEGETLAARLSRGRVPVPAACEIGAQIAEALDAAHKHGVVHRDLTPANVMLWDPSPDGGGSTQVKLLDFGLATLRDPTSHAREDLSALTATASPTAAGETSGTRPYMSPEQVEGQPTDARTDIWSLGCLLYEMLTGRRAFTGTSAASVTAAILDREPEPLRTMQPTTPPALAHLVGQCLAKRLADRRDSAHDLAEELRWIARRRPQSGLGALTANWRKAVTPAIAALAALAGAAGVLRLLDHSAADPAPVESRANAVRAPVEGALGSPAPADNPTSFEAHTSNTRAFDLYLKARTVRSSRTTDDHRRAIPILLEAIAEDATFALPYVALADTYAHLYVSDGAAPRNEAYRLAQGALAKALSLAKDSARVLAVKATLEANFENDLDGAERDFARAIRLQPRDPDVLEAHHLFLIRRGRLDAACEELDLLVSIDPAVPQNYFYRGRLYYYQHRYDDALAEYDKALGIDPSHLNTIEWMVLAFLAQKRPERAAEAVVRIERRDPPWASASRAWIAAAVPSGSIVGVRDRELPRGRWARAVYYASLGERNAALAQLARLAETNAGVLSFCFLTHVFDKYRADPAFLELLERSGFEFRPGRARDGA